VIPFPATHRSVLERIRSDDEEERRIAFGDLAEGYCGRAITIFVCIGG
jgi:hypothetical protein